MTVELANITFDCRDAGALGTFWSAALGRPLDDGANEHFAAVGLAGRAPGATAWLFLQVPERKTAKNRCHVDLTAADRDAEVARLVGLGATHVADKEEWGGSWAVLHDPEGNEFCVGTA